MPKAPSSTFLPLPVPLTSPSMEIVTWSSSHQKVQDPPIRDGHAHNPIPETPRCPKPNWARLPLRPWVEIRADDFDGGRDGTRRRFKSPRRRKVLRTNIRPPPEFNRDFRLVELGGSRGRRAELGASGLQPHRRRHCPLEHGLSRPSRPAVPGAGSGGSRRPTGPCRTARVGAYRSDRRLHLDRGKPRCAVSAATRGSFYVPVPGGLSVRF